MKLLSITLFTITILGAWSGTLYSTILSNWSLIRSTNLKLHLPPSHLPQIYAINLPKFLYAIYTRKLRLRKWARRATAQPLRSRPVLVSFRTTAKGQQILS